MPRKTKAERQAIERGKLGGAVRTKAKIAAARVNGAKGGRPQTSLILKVECGSVAEADAIREKARTAGVSVGEWLRDLAVRSPATRGKKTRGAKLGIDETQEGEHSHFTMTNTNSTAGQVVRSTLQAAPGARMPISHLQVPAIRATAVESGDTEMVALCDRAARRDISALAEITAKLGR